jgi:hypothetical protein
MKKILTFIALQQNMPPQLLLLRQRIQFDPPEKVQVPSFIEFVLNVSIQEIKNVPKIFKLLQTNKVYLTEHRWTEDVWDTVQLGFFLGLDPTFYDPIQAKQKVQKDISSQLRRSKPPKFEMTYATPSLKEGNFNVRTKAYAIEVQRCHAMELIKILKDTYMETKSFVQFQMKNKSPEAFGRTIMQQNRLFEANHVILLNYVGSDVMYYLMDRIMSIRAYQRYCTSSIRL